ncbi:MAG TPA: MFS transporter [Gemmatimonadales bacterium]
MTSSSTWMPLRIRVFRMMWLAALASNIATWMQTVGAQWMLVHGPHPALLVALVQTADMVPDFAFGLVGGVLADTLNRRRLLIAVQCGLAVVGTALAVVTFARAMTPPLLLGFTFILGFSSVFATPAFQSLVPDLVPRDQLVAASSLSSISVNAARSLGPAIAGVVIAWFGVGAVFALNAVIFAATALALVLWQPSRQTARPTLRAESFLPAIRAGWRYIQHSPVVVRLLVRAASFLVPTAALWALLPLIASERLRLGAGGYGILLGALGVGAIGGAILLGRLRALLSLNRVVMASSAVCAGALVEVAMVRVPAITVITLFLTGVAWTAVLSSVNAELQLFLPAWVRARGLSVYQMVLLGALAFGSALWGAFANYAGLVPTFLVAAGCMVAGAATIAIWPFIDTRGMDRSTVPGETANLHTLGTTSAAGPVVVHVTYTIAAEHQPAFLEAMIAVRLSRLRTGATDWGLLHVLDSPDSFTESFMVPTWEEHVRQHTERLTGTDQVFLDAAKALSDPAPRVVHLGVVDLSEQPAQ